ncbi:MAG: glutaredoxin family protein [Candidatus Magnetobacterium sp. LHC-1]|uniref:Glutaredoxin family protein n=1 Tax=Candidatus Magnetobacterium casense TaxID=1455061 RepID=A0ABS6RZ62_9BACT|nr:glutaredoxin family protein [Candidatus Magnetobacterium casensis]MBF0606914.1 glutaredoxin family protein [Nitrospirota bacterium]MBV6341937.1 glutaredoxin family protein [Candidatus Magnetobacterium casensis]
MRNIVLFALSTCPACKKTRDLLDTNKIEYVLVELDLVDLDSRDKLLGEVRRFNPRETFPTLVINKGEKVIVGYDESELKGEFGGH